MNPNFDKNVKLLKQSGLNGEIEACDVYGLQISYDNGAMSLFVHDQYVINSISAKFSKNEAIKFRDTLRRYNDKAKGISANFGKVSIGRYRLDSSANLHFYVYDGQPTMHFHDQYLVDTVHNYASLDSVIECTDKVINVL